MTPEYQYETSCRHSCRLASHPGMQQLTAADTELLVSTRSHHTYDISATNSAANCNKYSRSIYVKCGGGSGWTGVRQAERQEWPVVSLKKQRMQLNSWKRRGITFQEPAGNSIILFKTTDCLSLRLINMCGFILCRMCVKALVDKSAFETINDDCPDLVNFCAVMEHIFTHRIQCQLSQKLATKVRGHSNYF